MTKPTYDELTEALMDATAHLVGAVSAYETYAGNSKRKSVRDAFFNTRLRDYKKSIARVRAVVRRLPDRPKKKPKKKPKTLMRTASASFIEYYGLDKVPWVTVKKY